MLNISYKLYSSKKNKKIHAMINTSAWIWNHCIALQKRYYRMYKKYINVNRMQKHIAKLRNRNPKWKLLNSQTVQEICQRVDTSYQRFFKRLSKRPPKFKKACNFNSFILKNSGWEINKNKLTIKKIGVFKFSKSRHYENVKRICVKRDSLGYIYLFLACDMSSIKYKREGNSSVGIDFGLKTYLTFSDETEKESPLFFYENQKQLKKANKALSTKKKGSNNRKKAKIKLAKIHKNIANARNNFQWELAHEICKQSVFIAHEDLNMDAMKRLWGKKVSDLAFSDFIKKLEQVAEKYGTYTQVVGRFFPSTKKCGCGSINKELTLSDRFWTCKSCGVTNQRDLLAASNILSEGIRLYRTNHKTPLAGADWV